jgi:hypothetical protein
MVFKQAVFLLDGHDPWPTKNFPGGIRTHNRLIRRNGIPPIIVAGVTCPNFGRMLGHSLAILMTTYAHYIPGTQDEAARVMDDILTPIPIDLRMLEK